ncbi:DUF1540 domain-containing protein [Heliobacterium gestii]|uniref:DUF1540 domain-containing protein n=1 Tax=Heliomicrobium gestii TaxID=2699 RepID=A0A845LCL7_HELGE|nr:DUF1540 domain-containing protein [Heliomicrobium gestii]MBM7865997.1 hypothetical protein [Heliomicrobium gestii]MZP42670.1 DUF1540 domain-containing protein [Heliomicrobium gestii]
MPQQHIHCIVSNCHYYQSGNKCVANEILVASDKFGSNQPDNVDATMAAQLSAVSASDCMSTCCKSFVPKDSGKADVDGVKRMQ